MNALKQELQQQLQQELQQQRQRQQHQVAEEDAGGKSSGRWEDAEHAAFLDGLQRFGRDWKRIARACVRACVRVRVRACVCACVRDVFVELGCCGVA